MRLNLLTHKNIKGQQADTALAVFWSRVVRRGPDECWQWTGHTLPKGYGAFTAKSKPYYAHRYSWLIHFGPIPKGMLVCHHCDNPGCVNPAHLFTGTHKDNMQDAASKRRIKWTPSKHPRYDVNGGRLKDEEVVQIRTMSGTQKYLAIKFGVSVHTIANIKQGATYRRLLTASMEANANGAD